MYSIYTKEEVANYKIPAKTWNGVVTEKIINCTEKENTISVVKLTDSGELKGTQFTLMEEGVYTDHINASLILNKFGKVTFKDLVRLDAGDISFKDLIPILTVEEAIAHTTCTLDRATQNTTIIQSEEEGLTTFINNSLSAFAVLSVDLPEITKHEIRSNIIQTCTSIYKHCVSANIYIDTGTEPLRVDFTTNKNYPVETRAISTLDSFLEELTNKYSEFGVYMYQILIPPVEDYKKCLVRFAPYTEHVGMLTKCS